MQGFNIEMLLAGRYHDWLIAGFVTTIQLSVLAYAFALVLGILIASLRMINFRPLQWFAFVYVEYHRNTPALVQLFFWYFAMPEILPTGVSEWINGHNGEFIFAAVALGLCISAYIAEDIRSGLRSVPPQQQEAARAIGFGFLQTLRLIVLPQALRIAAPALINRALITVKNSSLAMAIGVGELIYRARQVEAMTFKAFEAFSFITICYLVITLSLMAMGRWYEHRQQLTR